VANLASFLTRVPPIEYISTIEDAVNSETTISICISRLLLPHAQASWPEARFVTDTANDTGTSGLFKAFDDKKCSMLALGMQEIYNPSSVEMLCENQLIFTNSRILSKDLAYPVQPKHVKGMSYWLDRAEKEEGITYMGLLKESAKVQPTCEIQISAIQETDDFAKVTVENFFIAWMAFFACAFVAVVLHALHLRAMRKGATRTSLGRSMSDVNKEYMRSEALAGFKSGASTRAQDAGLPLTEEFQSLVETGVLDSFVSHYNEIKSRHSSSS